MTLHVAVKITASAIDNALSLDRLACSFPALLWVKQETIFQIDRQTKPLSWLVTYLRFDYSRRQYRR